MAIHHHMNDLPAGVSFGAIVAIDTETMGLDPRRDRLCVVQLSRGDGCAGELVEHDGGGVGDDDLPGRCSECCRPDGIADRVRPLHPFVGPPPNEPLRPLPIDERFETLRGDLQGTAEGIAVEVGEDIAVAGVDEAVEIALEGIRGVEVVGSLEKGHGVTGFLEGALRGSRRGLAGRR